MKATIKITLAILVLLFLLSIQGVKAGEEYTRIIRKEFAVNPDAQLTISNRFGKVHCSNWDRNSVSIEVTITLTAADQESAEKKFRKIAIDFTDSPTSVTAVTNMEEMKNSGKGRFSIDYMVSLPASMSIDLTNKFGDIYINEVLGKAKVTLSYGNLDARKFGNSDNLLDIRFGKVRVNWIKGAVLTLKYSEMDLEYAGSLRLDSKYSDFDAAKVIALTSAFEGGKLKIENSSAVDSRSRFSDIDIGRLEQSLILDIQYGNCSIDEMPADFTQISIRNKYGNVDVGLNDKANYTLEADLKFCDLDYPDSKAKFSYRSITPTEKSYKGTIGSTDTPAGKVIVKSEYGNVSLR